MKTQTIKIEAGESYKVHGEHTGQTVEGPAVIVILARVTEETDTRAKIGRPKAVDSEIYSS